MILGSAFEAVVSIIIATLFAVFMNKKKVRMTRSSWYI